MRRRSAPETINRLPVRVDVRNRGTDSAIVFIHGFAGQLEKTWGRFPAILANHPELDDWDIFSVGYSSSLRLDVAPFWAADAGLTVLGYYLRTVLAMPPLNRYRNIALIAHSMGGLIAQQAVLDADVRSRISHVFLFGTPSLGVNKANPFGRLKQQVRDMAVGSGFIGELRAQWACAYTQDRPFALHVIAGERDTFVPINSAFEPFADNVRYVVPGTHTTMVRPDDSRSLSVQIVVRGLASAPKRDNLPTQLTSFIGRDEHIAALTQLLEEHRLVTIVGTGGAGKTRLALELGSGLLGSAPDGVWVAALAAITNASLVQSVIAQALNIQESQKHTLLEMLLAYLKDKRLLLILDNCEHVISEAGDVVTAILRNCTAVRIVATSRERLNVPGENVYRIPSLSAPPSDVVRADNVSQYAAVQLFVDRAILLNRRFALTDENAPHVGEICRRLDGIPFAIELAAARVQVLSPQQLLQKLNERFRVLAGGDRNALPRQQTMRALIDWSYDLLSDRERRFFRRLSIFSGGFTLEMAGKVCCGAGIDELDILDLVQSLLDKSLIQAEASADVMRYRLLESTRDYAREKLIECDEQPAAALAHAEAFLALAEDLESTFETTPDSEWLAQIYPEMDNWRAALDATLTARGDVLLGQRLAGALRWVWWNVAAAEGRHWIRVAAAEIDSSTPAAVIAKLDLAAAWIDGSFTQYKASLAAAERALTRYRELNDALGIAEALGIAGRSLILLAEYARGEALLNECIETAKRIGAQKLAVCELIALGSSGHLADDQARAESYFVEALELAQTAGAETLTAVAALNRAEIEFRKGNAQAALHVAEKARTEGLPRSRELAATGLSNMAAYLVVLERYAEARTLARDALTLSRDAQAEVGAAFCLQHLAAVATHRLTAESSDLSDHATRAARLLGYVDARLECLEARREFTEQFEYDEILRSLRHELELADLVKAMGEGRAWNDERAITEALLI
ncbi:MAG: hypothetical protein JO322_16210 [Candidatus Eremiobacteraeota bacterium]|nr:hypothetical protein [Candidatus Eremiobacteraeota bacterium]